MSSDIARKYCQIELKKNIGEESIERNVNKYFVEIVGLKWWMGNWLISIREICIVSVEMLLFPIDISAMRRNAISKLWLHRGWHIGFIDVAVFDVHSLTQRCADNQSVHFSLIQKQRTDGLAIQLSLCMSELQNIPTSRCNNIQYSIPQINATFFLFCSHHMCVCIANTGLWQRERVCSQSENIIIGKRVSIGRTLCVCEQHKKKKLNRTEASNRRSTIVSRVLTCNLFHF